MNAKLAFTAISEIPLPGSRAAALMGRLTDRFGIAAPVICGALALSTGYVAAGFVHILIGLGSSATFGPLIADTSEPGPAR
jgi:hypothetical protein